MRGLTTQQRMQSSNGKNRYMLLTILITLLPALPISSIYPAFSAVQKLPITNSYLPVFELPSQAGWQWFGGLSSKLHVRPLKQTCLQFQNVSMCRCRDQCAPRGADSLLWGTGSHLKESSPPGHQWRHPDKIFSALHISWNTTAAPSSPVATLLVQPYKIYFN